jgi:hypothetical protein
MNKYVALYNRKQIRVEAMTSYEAQKIAAKLFKAPHSYNVSVHIIETGGKEVIHTASD